MNNLREVFQKYAAVVFFDTETSGLDADTCQIIELAAIRIEQTGRGTLRVVKTFDDFIRLPEGEKLPEKITELTGITDEMLEKGRARRERRRVRLRGTARRHSRAGAAGSTQRPV